MNLFLKMFLKTFGLPRQVLSGNVLRFCSNSVKDWRSQHDYKWFICVQTRWNDNDQYGHINNANYHAIYDTVINIFLIRHCGLKTDLNQSSHVGFMVTNECKFYAPAQYPFVYLAGMAVSHIGNSSIRYKLSLFPPNDDSKSVSTDLVRGHFPGDKILNEFSSSSICTGEYVHVFVDPKNGNRPIAIPDLWKSQLLKLKS